MARKIRNLIVATVASAALLGVIAPAPAGAVPQRSPSSGSTGGGHGMG